MIDDTHFQKESDVCTTTIDEVFGLQNNILDCPDGSDEMCDDPCVPDTFKGRSTMKVRKLFSKNSNELTSFFSFYFEVY